MANESRAASLLTAAILCLLAVGALAFQTYGLPDTWLADEITWVVKEMVARRSFDPKHFMYPSLMVDVCYALARLLGLESWTALGHLCRTVSAGFYLGAVLALGRAVEVVLGERRPFAYFFTGTIGALLHHAHIATVNSGFFFTIALALLQFVRTLRSKREKDFYLSVAACSLACAAKYNGVFLFGALPVLWLLALGDIRSRRFLRAVAVSLLIAPLPFLATTPYLLLDWETFHKEWRVLTDVEGPAFKWDASTLSYFKYFFGYSIAFFTPVGLALVALWGVLGYGSWLRELTALRTRRPLVFQGALIFAATLALYLLMNWRIGILQSRYYLPADLILAQLFLLALYGHEKKRLRAATLALLLVMNTANAWANVLAYRLAAKAQALSVLEPLEGRIGVIAYPQRRPFQPGPLDARTDTFTVDLGDQDVESFEEYLTVIERFFAERRPRYLVFEKIVTEWGVFRPRRDVQDYGARLRYPNPGFEAWDRHLRRAGYEPVQVIENCQGPLALRWLLGSYYLWAAEGVGRPVYIYERRGALR